MWPDDELPVEVFAAFGANPDSDPGDWTWTDLSGRLLTNPIPLRKGSGSGSGDVSPSTATIHLLNDDGDLTPLRPESEYWPNVALGTPIWLTLRRVEDAFGRSVSNGWGTSDGGLAWATANGSPGDYSVSSGQGRIAHSTLNVLRQVRAGVSLLDTHHVVDTSTSALITGAALVTGVMARHDPAVTDYYWLRTEFNSGGTTVMLKITRVRGGTHTDLGSVGAVPGLSYAASTPLRTRISVVGNRLSMKVWTAAGSEPAGWQLDVTDPDPLTSAGGVGMQTWLIPGNTNVLPVTVSHDNYTVRADVFNGFADQWQPQFIPSTDGMTSIVRLTASGILRRLGQGNGVIRSALTRYLPSTNPVAWWPLEDGVDSTQAASGLPDGQPLSVSVGIMDFVDDAPPGASGSAHPQPDAKNALRGVVAGVDPAGWQVAVWTKGVIVSGAAGAHYVAWEIRTTTGKILRLIHQYGADAAVGVGLYLSEDQENETDLVSLNDPVPRSNLGITGEWLHVVFTAQQSGADTNVWLDVNDVTVAGATWAGQTIGAPLRIDAIGAFAGDTGSVSDDMADIYLSHLSFHNSVPLIFQHDAGMGFPYEPASDRIQRVCDERGIRITVAAGDSEPLGPQPAGGDLDILRDAEHSDMGILYERGWGLGYRPRSTRYNQVPALTVDLETYMHSQEMRPEQILAPTYDDQGTRNDVTVSRTDGSSARVVDSEHAARHGVYDDSVTIGVAADSALPSHAGWRVHLGTWEEMRYPGISVDLAGQPDLIDSWLNVTPGDRVQQVNVPAPHPSEDVDQHAGGISQTLTRLGSWGGSIVGTPARPWTVGVVEDPVLGRADTGGSQWADDVDAGTDTSALVVVTAGPPWITTASQPSMFPLDVRSAGVVLSVTGIETAARDTFTRSVGAGGWGTATTGQPWSVNSGAAGNWSVTGAVGRIATATVNQLELATINVNSVEADPRAEFLLPVAPIGSGISLWVSTRFTDTSNYYYATLLITSGAVPELRLFKRVAGTGTQLGSTVTLNGPHVAGDRWVLQCSAIGSTIRARGWKSTQPAERGWHITATDTALTTGTRAGVGVRRETGNTNGTVSIDVDPFEAPGLQAFTFAATPVNQVTKTIPTGTPLSLATPWRLAL
jgi:hypothetical protein